jgi:hypothetical protein
VHRLNDHRERASLRLAQATRSEGFASLTRSKT